VESRAKQGLPVRVASFGRAPPPARRLGRIAFDAESVVKHFAEARAAPRAVIVA
jgi:hypothetical protein